MAKRIGVLLSGCGYPDGSETQKAVLTLLALDRAGAEPVCLAPDIEQAQVVNHLTGQTEPIERRNALVEAARIARGNASPLVFEEAAGLDGLMVPGAMGRLRRLLVETLCQPCPGFLFLMFGEALHA